MGIQATRGLQSPAETLGNNNHHFNDPVASIGSRLMKHYSTVAPPRIERNSIAKSSTAVEALPWKQSINPTRDLTYMPMFESHLEKMGLLNMKQVSLEEKFIYRESDVKPARMGNMCFQNEHFRKVRLTYFDGGDSVQVFNSVWYPAYEYDLPILGIDLISLGKNRVLNVIDFQPLHPTEEYSAKYIDPLTHIRDKYPDLQGVLSGKIYDDTSFFSKNMLFGRFTDESKVKSSLYPAYEEYLDAYVKLMHGATADFSPARMEEVKARQTAYDTYSALKDPAVGLFDAYFGKEWSASFVHDFLFSLSKNEHTAGASGVAIPASHHQQQVAGAVAATAAAPAHVFRIDSATGEVLTSGTHKH